MKLLWVALALTLVATPAAADPATLVITGLQAFGITVGATAAAFIRIGVGLAFSALSSALAGPANANQGPRGITLQSLTAGEQTPASFILGRYVTAGNLTAPEMSHGVNGDTRYLTRVIDFSDIRITGLDSLIIDGKACELATGATDPLTMTGGDGTTQAINSLYGPTVNKGDFIGFAWCRFYDGSQTSADSMLRSKYGSYPQRPWTAQMIGRDVAYAAMTFLWRDSPQVWNGRPDVKFVVRGIKLYDPRKDSTVNGTASGIHRYGDTSNYEWTENPVVMIYNLYRGIVFPGGDVYGGGYAASDLPYATWAAAMNACDVMVGDRKTYTAGYEVFTGGSDAGGQSPADVVDELKRSCSAEITDVGGTVYIRVGAPTLPVRFITDDDILVSQATQLDPFPGAQDSYNIVGATWVNPNKLWSVVEATQRRDVDAIAADGEELVANLALAAVTNSKQVQQLTNAWMKDAKRHRRHTIVLPPEGIVLKPLDVIEWTSARNGYTTKQFEIGTVTIDTKSLATTLAIREVNPNDYNWTAGDELADTAPSVEEVNQARQAEYRVKRDTLIAETASLVTFGRPFTDTQFTDWLTYWKALQDLPDTPADPAAVVFPTAPAEFSGTDGLSVFGRLYRRGNVLGDPTRVLGIPTGPLMDTATNANGVYHKTVDGTLICTHRMAVSYSTASNLQETWTFPHAFGAAGLDRRSVHVTLSNKNNSNAAATGQLSNARLADIQPFTNSQGLQNSVSIILRDKTSALVAGDVCWVELMAFGRWDN
ncbi:MAG: phage tail protein [Planctomycetia bacterium]|jgi:hypothetical protein